MDSSRIRSILFVPGDSPRKLAKALSVPADAILIDWEDAVADSNKVQARSVTRAALPTLAAQARPVLVRVNPYHTQWGGDDCEAVCAWAPDGVVIPKCELASDVSLLASKLPGVAALFPLIESPLGVLNAAQIASSSPRVKALLFGAEDYCAEARIQRTEGEPEVTYARCCVVNAARAMRKQVFDSPLMQYKHVAAVRRSAWHGRRLGFSGQAAIHPDQVPVINEVYSPSADEVAAARAVLKRFEEHGGGAYGVDGTLEDQPAVENALAVLRQLGPHD